MIRPLTILTFLLACGSGLYLYQSKHEVQVLDRTIEKTVHETTALREQSRLLSAEWTMLNDPERLRQFSDTYLNLKSINPAQFTSLADLNGKLPQVQIAAPAPAAEEEVPIASGEPQQPVAAPEAAPAIEADEVMPVPPVPSPLAAAAKAPAPKVPVVASVPRQPDLKLAVARPGAPELQPRPVVAADSHPTEQRVVAPKMAAALVTQPQRQTQSPVQVPVQASRPIVLAAPRPLPANTPAYRSTANQAASNQSQGNQFQGNQPAAAYQRPVAAQPAMAPAPYGGSLLGMARGSMPQAPRPTPVNATYNTN